MSEPRPLRLAATCIPVRETRDGVEILMVKRNPDLSFGGMWTFPGGTLEPDDGSLPDTVEEDMTWSEPSLVHAAATGAARETLEEAGLTCTISSLAWFSHWIPPRVGPPKRFATWFFLAPEHQGELVVDGTENTDAVWTSPSAALDAYAEGEFPLSVPTWVTLDDLGRLDSVASALDHAVTRGPRFHHTRAFPVDAGRVLVWYGDAAYDDGNLARPGARNRAVVDDDFRVVDRVRG